MSEFSRRVDFHVFKDEPLTFNEYVHREFPGHQGQKPTQNELDWMATQHRAYVAAFQPYRWHAVTMNNKIISDGESYYNEADCINAIEALGGDDTTAYYMRTYGEQRGLELLRYGKTDRDAQAAQ